MSARPFAVFDIDGTLLRWQLYHAVADELAKTGHLDNDEFKKIRQARMTWKQRAHSDSYVDYEKKLIEFFEKAILDVKKKDLENACEVVINTYKDQVYTFTRDLIRDLKKHNYLIFAISASQDEIVKMLANYYDFDDAVGSYYEEINGVYSGKNQITKENKKPEVLKKLVLKHSASWDKSIGVGDSESDVEMLKVVERPIVFNPTKGLFDIAKRNNWEVVIERKNTIYKLMPQNGQYWIK